LRQYLIKSADSKIRYPQVIRKYILESIAKLLTQHQVESQRIYFCMENDAHFSKSLADNSARTIDPVVERS